MKVLMLLGLVGAAIYGALVLSSDLFPHDPAENAFAWRSLGNPSDRQLSSWGTDLSSLARSSSQEASLPLPKPAVTAASTSPSAGSEENQLLHDPVSCWPTVRPLLKLQWRPPQGKWRERQRRPIRRPRQRSPSGRLDRQLGCRTSSPLHNSTGDGSGALHAAAVYFSSAAASLELSEPAYRQRIGAIGEGTMAPPTHIGRTLSSNCGSDAHAACSFDARAAWLTRSSSSRTTAS